MKFLTLMLLATTLYSCSSIKSKTPQCSLKSHQCQTGRCKADKSCCGDECGKCTGETASCKTMSCH